MAVVFLQTEYFSYFLLRHQNNIGTDIYNELSFEITTE